MIELIGTGEQTQSVPRATATTLGLVTALLRLAAASLAALGLVLTAATRRRQH